MTNLKTTIGGALSALGTTLVGIGVVPQLAGVPSKWLTYCAVTGFICSALGKFFSALFSADASTVQRLSDKVDVNTASIAKSP